jgi:hypothetical protein
VIDRPLSRAMRPLRKLIRAGMHGVDARVVHQVAREIVGSTGAWTVHSARRARSGTRIVTLEDYQGRSAFLKLADSAGGSTQLAREGRNLIELANRIADADLLALLPEPLDAGQHGRWAYLLQRGVAGEPGTPLLAASASRRWLVDEAAGLALRFHDATAEVAQVTGAQMDEWVDRPLQLIVRLASPSPATAGQLESIRSELRQALVGSELKLGFIHGDFWSENLLADHRTRRITGIVDWDSADPANLVAHDLLHLLLYTRKLVRTSQIGTEICRALGPDPRWEPEELRAIERATSQMAATSSASLQQLRLAVMLYWLRLVSTNHARQPKVTSHRRWVRDNIDAVVACA